MGDKFIIVGITPNAPMTSPKREAEVITSILANKEADFFHLRHPDLDADGLREILLHIDEEYRNLITLHDHFELLSEGLCGGIQLNSRNYTIPEYLTDSKTSRVRIGRSCHSFEELSEADKKGIDYATLSPIFDSISKTDYPSRFKLESLSEVIQTMSLKVIALGGVTPDKFPILSKAGFSGAAMLGYFAKYFI